MSNYPINFHVLVVAAHVIIMPCMTDYIATRQRQSWRRSVVKINGKCFCSIHLVADCAVMKIDNPSCLQFVNYHQGILKTLNTLGVGQKYAKAEFPDQVEGARKFLYRVCAMKYWTDVARFKRSVDDALIRIEMPFPVLFTCTSVPSKKS
jgi:hypothetical protein